MTENQEDPAYPQRNTTSCHRPSTFERQGLVGPAAMLAGCEEEVSGAVPGVLGAEAAEGGVEIAPHKEVVAATLESLSPGDHPVLVLGTSRGAPVHLHHLGRASS